MKFILKKYFVISLSVVVLFQLIPAIEFDGNLGDLFQATLILMILYYLFRPIATLIALPINLLTLNLFSWIINILVFYVWTILTGKLTISGWQFQGVNLAPIVLSPFDFASWQVILIAGIVLTVIIQFFEWLVK